MADTVEFLRQPQAITTNTIFNLYDALFMKCFVSVIQDAMGLKRFKKVYLFSPQIIFPKVWESSRCFFGKSGTCLCVLFGHPETLPWIPF